MFDIGFWEMVMCAVVALVVIGPKDLPRVARIAGLWVGRARRSLAVVKDEIDRELRAQELKDILTKQTLNNPVERILEEPLLESPPEFVHPASGVDLSPSRPDTGGGKA